MNPILDTDSYKPSHIFQMDPSISASYFYLEARGGMYSHTMVFGLQYIIKKYLCRQITVEHIVEAEALFKEHGLPFSKAAFLHILRQHNGYWPVVIRAAREGAIIPTGNVLATVQSTDPECAWVPSYIEDTLLRLWYPCTVATRSAYIKHMIKMYMIITCDNLDGLDFKLHDFGARGASSHESASLGGTAHLVNFRGSDTVPALVLAREYYNEPMAGYSIPAAEHFTVTGWGRDHEYAAYAHALSAVGVKGGMLAVVCDSYDVYNAVDNIWGQQLRQAVKDSGVTLVLRPDSGVPHVVVLKVLELLANRFGYTINSKGFKVLNGVRVIHGDSINERTIKQTLLNIVSAGFSVDNVAFGMGGELLQNVNRDTQGFAMKCSAVAREGKWYPIFKSPVDAPGKRSKSGVVTLMREGNEYKTIDTLVEVAGWRDTGGEALETIYANGCTYRAQSLNEIRKVANDHSETTLIVSQHPV